MHKNLLYKMLNRRILRIKAFKALYSYAENPSMTLAEVQSQFETSCEAARSLYLKMLAIIPCLTDEALSRIEAAKTKFTQTEEERNPNLKFVGNSIAPLLKDDPDLAKILSRRKLGWENCDALIRNVFSSILTKDYYKEYMADPRRSLRQDADLFIRIFEEEFVDREDLCKILEDESIWWNDDLAYSLSVCCDTLRDLGRGRRWDLPPLYRSEITGSEESDKDFASKLVRTSYSCFEKYSALVAESTDQWEKDRLFTTDTVLIVMGLSEAKAFPELPLRVTINEYVEISKFYSTPNSRRFVNGLLDRLIKKQIEEGDIVKTEKID